MDAYKVTFILWKEVEFEADVEAKNEEEAIQEGSFLLEEKEKDGWCYELHDVVRLEPIKIDGPIYAVQYIEAEFGQRNEGWKLYLDKDVCVKKTLESAKNGAYPGGGGYLGPIKPLVYYEIPLEGLPQKYLRELQKSGVCFTDKSWSPKYRDGGHSVK